jgi:hypothetical protein
VRQIGVSNSVVNAAIRRIKLCQLGHQHEKAGLELNSVTLYFTA